MLIPGHGKACLLACAGSYVLYYIYKNWSWRISIDFKGHIRNSLTKSKMVVKEVLLFPDKGFPCYAHLEDNDCQRERCSLMHEPTSLSRLKNLLKSAEKSLKICVFVITCQDLADAAVAVIKRKIPVQVITDATMEDANGSQIYKFRKEGVPVRTLASTFLMHHKFALVDDELLIMGSFNWTQTAVIGNLESVIVTNDPDIVKPFVAEYDRLWRLMNPVDASGGKHWGKSENIADGCKV